MNYKKKEVLGEYTVGRTLGWGAFSTVKLCEHKATGKKYAIKVIDKKKILELQNERQQPSKSVTEQNGNGAAAGARNRATIPGIHPVDANNVKQGDTSRKNESLFKPALYSEVQLLMRLNHPNIVRLHKYIETEDYSYMIMDYASGGELMKKVIRRRGLPEDEVRKYFRQILSAVDHCHLSNVVHRDLKLENILLSKSGDILITDFGFGRMFKPDHSELMGTFCGTPNYAAAELVTGIKYMGVKSDIWSLGVIVFFMVAGRPPFLGKDISSLYTSIRLVDYTCPVSFSPELVNLLCKIFIKNPNERIDMNGLRMDPWINYNGLSPPSRITPTFCTKCDAEMDRFISGIFYNRLCTTFTFYRSENGDHCGVDSNSSTSQLFHFNECKNLIEETQKNSEDGKEEDPGTQGPLSPESLNEATKSATVVQRRNALKDRRRRYASCIPTFDDVLIYDIFKNGMVVGNHKEDASLSLPNIDVLLPLKDDSTNLNDGFVAKNRDMFLICRMSTVGSVLRAGNLDQLSLESTRGNTGDASLGAEPSRVSKSGFILGNLGDCVMKNLIPEITHDKKIDSCNGRGGRNTNTSNNRLCRVKPRKQLSVELERCESNSFVPSNKLKKQTKYNSLPSSVARQMFSIIPTLAEIRTWHITHRLPKSIKVVYFPLSVDLVFHETSHVIFRNLYCCIVSAKLLLCKEGVIKRPSDSYKIICKVDINNRHVELSAEVLKILFSPRSHGVTFTCISGDKALYKSFRNKIIQMMRSESAS